jgi:signal transduction histidine kinase/CheY-like chemotaxis protein
MSDSDTKRTYAELAEENAMFLGEIDVARQASKITAELVVRQFVLLEQSLATEQQLKDELAGKLREAEVRERQLAEARAAAESANRAKSTFLASMSHELRTPLNAIIGYSEMLEEEAEDHGLTSLIPDLKRIQAAGKHLLSLINDVLDLSKVEAGKVELYAEDTEVRRLIEDVVSTVQPLAEKNSNALVLNVSPRVGTIRTDVTRLRQCLFNLLSNACKFTQQGQITLRVRRQHVKGEDWIWFAVTDSGVGISEEQQTRIFEPFQQADQSTTRQYGGTGLGLAITRRLCQMMGGDVSVKSAPGQGSTFAIRIPTTLQAKSVPAQSGPRGVETRLEPTRGAPGSKVVLVIDDEAEPRDMISRFLRKHGIHAVTVASGEEGIALARQLRPAVITLDVVMPRMDGWAVLEALKAEPATSDIPVIIVSILSNQDLGFAVGAMGYVTKPIDWARLLGLLTRYTHGNRDIEILVVEDEEVTRELLRRTLEKQGWAVAEAVNGRAALNFMARRRPGLILLDLMMPEMDGFEFLVELRKQREWWGIPIIVVTAKDLTSDDRRRLEGQVVKIIQKAACTTDELLRDVCEFARQYVKPLNGALEPQGGAHGQDTAG